LQHLGGAGLVTSVLKCLFEGVEVEKHAVKTVVDLFGYDGGPATAAVDLRATKEREVHASIM
jgi:hypothetical protein